jgi:hypothetical protein
VINGVSDPVKIVLPFENIDEHFMEDIEVALPSTDIVKRNPPTVAVMFNVQKLIIVRDSVDLRIENLPSNIWPVIGRRRIPVTIGIPENMMDEYVSDSVAAVLDLRNVKRGTRMVQPRIVGIPPFSKIVSVDSVKIKF